MSIYQDIATNYHTVLGRVEQAALKAGRDSASVKLVVVTKDQPLDRIKAVVESGACNLGENRFEEALPKMQSLADHKDLRWHMIGHVQSRKAELALRGFQLVHSLDSLKLAGIYNRLAAEQVTTLPVLLELRCRGGSLKVRMGYLQGGIDRTGR